METLSSIDDYARMPDRIRPETSNEAITERLIQLRVAISGESQIAFCAKTGLKPNAWNNLEKGRNRISIDTALELARSTGASLDWIYRGRDYEHTLSGGLASRIRAARDALGMRPLDLRRA
ncbi:MAG: helix-turn-helix transcriptional regulator [Sphingopyxis sp.]|nr:helix-turn-helix transcriptional regulator [Sphingopyxis sp.]